MRSAQSCRRGRRSGRSVSVGAGAAAAGCSGPGAAGKFGVRSAAALGRGAGLGPGSAAAAEASWEESARPRRGRRALVSAGRRLAAARGRCCRWPLSPRARAAQLHLGEAAAPAHLRARAPGRREGAASSSRGSFIVFLTSAVASVRQWRAGGQRRWRSPTSSYSVALLKSRVAPSSWTPCAGQLSGDSRRATPVGVAALQGCAYGDSTALGIVFSYFDALSL